MFLNAHSLEAAKFASSSEARPVLASLNITSSHCVATDSYHLLEVEHLDQKENQAPDGIRNDMQTGLIPAEAALHASKNIPKGETLFALKNAFSSVDPDGKRMTITTTDLMQEKSVEALMVDGKYPSYGNIFPDGEPVGRIMIDAKLLKNMAEYFTKHGDARKVLIEFHGESKPLVFKGETAGTIQSVRGLIMPQRMPEEVRLSKESVRNMGSELQKAMPDDQVTVSLNGEQL